LFRGELQKSTLSAPDRRTQVKRALMITAGLTATLLSAHSHAESGITYRFRSTTGAEDVATGKVWLVGDDARLEREGGDRSVFHGHVRIWKDGGKQVLVLDTKEHTYFDLIAYYAKRGLPTDVSVRTLTARSPFLVAGVSETRVKVESSSQRQSSPDAAEPACQPVTVTISYDLKLKHEVVPLTMPGHVDGIAEYCLVASPMVNLPFGHGVAIVSGIAEVDALIAERLAGVEGIPLRSALTVTRQIEGGERVSATTVVELSDFEAAEIPPERFLIPEGFRYKEPEIQAPVRKEE
jgi:hypothetical protein